MSVSILVDRGQFIPNAGGQAAVGRAVMLEPFLLHIFFFSTILSTFQQSLPGITWYGIPK
jgi:hypothetical protein